MRFLKTKIALAAQAKAQRENAQRKLRCPAKLPTSKAATELKAKIGSSVETPNKQPRPIKRKSRAKPRKTVKGTKTVVKNYGKAIASFAISSIATFYLIPLVEQYSVNLQCFVDYITSLKDSIVGIDTFRASLLPKEDDKEEIVAYKRLFREIGVIFVKYFSVNWIFSGKMKNRKVHLMMRFKMLRRLMNPEYFTYLK